MLEGEICTGICVNSSEERRKSGKKPYAARTQREHPFVASRDPVIDQNAEALARLPCMENRAWHRAMKLD
jgi:hypothetical protein